MQELRDQSERIDKSARTISLGHALLFRLIILSSLICTQIEIRDEIIRLGIGFIRNRKCWCWKSKKDTPFIPLPYSEWRKFQNWIKLKIEKRLKRFNGERLKSFKLQKKKKLKTIEDLEYFPPSTKSHVSRLLPNYSLYLYLFFLSAYFRLRLPFIENSIKYNLCDTNAS